MSKSLHIALSNCLTSHFHHTVTVTKLSSISGGDINDAYQCYVQHEKKSDVKEQVNTYFVKVNNSSTALDMFNAESMGLRALADTKTIRVPYVITVGLVDEWYQRQQQQQQQTPSSHDTSAFIIMEYLHFTSTSSAEDDIAFATKLASLHTYPQPHGDDPKTPYFGFPIDNTCGLTTQINTPTSDWVTFYREHRLGYQLSLISKNYNDIDLISWGQRLQSCMYHMFVDMYIQPILIHGDLWSGNYSMIETSDGAHEPVIYDPACYYGHYEAELSIMTMFGSPSATFWRTYWSLIPQHHSHFAQRQSLYQLYHYLNHYNLFGRSYRSTCMSILKRLVHEYEKKEEKKEQQEQGEEG